MRGLHRTAPLYDLTAETSGPAAAEICGALRASGFETRVGDQAPAETTVIIYGLDTINRAYRARGTFQRIGKGFLALGDFLATGTFWRYLRTSWRYGLFFLFPIVVWCALLALGWLAFGLLEPWGALPAAAGAAILFLALAWAADRQFHLLLLMDDWSFARDLARGRSTWLNGLMAAINTDVAARIEAFSGDEVIFAAHSLGVVPAIGALADTLRRRPAAEADAPPLGLLTVGSSLLKIALHPAAGALRADVDEVARSSCPWLEVQSVSDPISFYRSDPVEALGLSAPGRVRIMRISLSKLTNATGLKRFQFNLFRLHRQFVRPVEKRSAYSFHIILCGPAPFASVVRAKPVGLS